MVVDQWLMLSLDNIQDLQLMDTCTHLDVFLQRLNKALFLESTQSLLKSTNSRKNQPLRFQYIRRLCYLQLFSAVSDRF